MIINRKRATAIVTIAASPLLLFNCLRPASLCVAEQSLHHVTPLELNRILLNMTRGKWISVAVAGPTPTPFPCPLCWFARTRTENFDAVNAAPIARRLARNKCTRSTAAVGHI